MRKPKVKPLVSLIRRRVEVVLPLRVRHGAPLLIAAAVAQDVVGLGDEVEGNVVAGDGNEVLVAVAVARGVPLLVDVGGDDAG